MKVEHKSSLLFRDVLVTRLSNGGSSDSLHREPTHTDTVINALVHQASAI